LRESSSKLDNEEGSGSDEDLDSDIIPQPPLPPKWLRMIEFITRQPLGEDYTHEDVFYLGLTLCPLWFAGNILYNYSLLLTSITSSTIIRYIGTYEVMIMVAIVFEASIGCFCSNGLVLS
jgi:hypothetical protein